MVWMMAFWTILSSLSLPPRPDETLVLEFLLELSPSSKSTLILRCLSRVLNTSSTVGPAVTHTAGRQETSLQRQNWLWAEKFTVRRKWKKLRGELRNISFSDNMMHEELTSVKQNKSLKYLLSDRSSHSSKAWNCDMSAQINAKTLRLSTVFH